MPNNMVWRKNRLRVRCQLCHCFHLDLACQMIITQQTEPSEIEYDSEVTDEPEEDGDEDEEDDRDDTSIYSDVTSWSSGHDTDWTQHTNTANHNQKHNQRK